MGLRERQASMAVVLGLSGNAWKEAHGSAAWYLRFDLVSSALPFYEPGQP